MSLILGIDTGGTYTDAVILKYANKEILRKAKALTTKEDLAVGIQNCLHNLNFTDFKDVSLVSLSTTLATNAIVEGRGCKTGLILIGSKPEGKLPAEETVLLQGKFDIKGRMVQGLEEDEILEAIEKFRGKIDAVAISGYASVRNPAHELSVKKRVRESLNIPVVCGHELTSSLGFYERTVTAILNASLIPILDELISATKKVLKQRNIAAPIMIVKGDGSLMHESQAKEKPIETILSGPAASIIGGTFLTDTSDAIIVDMGGTTTDIACIESGTAKIREEGARVGGWLTRVKAADIWTFGIGGDSLLHFTPNGRLEVGPQKVWPLCVFGKRFPELIEELRSYRGKCARDNTFSPSEADFFHFVKIPAVAELSGQDWEIIKILTERPHNRPYLSERLGRQIELYELQRLIQLGILSQISLTPTDLLHAEGRYDQWDRQIAEAGVSIYAERLGQTIPEFLTMAKERITNEIFNSCLKSFAEFERHPSRYGGDKSVAPLLDKTVTERKEGIRETFYKLNKPIVALGAPVSAWIQKVAEKFNTALIIPPHSEVANAVGAAVGQVMNTIEVLIRPDHTTNRFTVYAPRERLCFDTLEEAVEHALYHGKEYAAGITRGNGGDSFDVFESRNDVYADSFCETKKTYVETRIEITAIERSAWRV